MGLRVTLNFRKCKVALNLMYRIFWGVLTKRSKIGIQTQNVI